MTRLTPRVRSFGRGLVGVVAVMTLATVDPGPVSSAEPVPGSAGIDTSLPLTESAVTVNGRGRFADLAVTVNQTRNLVNQAVSVTWEGGDPTFQSRLRFAGNFLQILQCWGEDDGTVPSNPGPPPQQCVQGATSGVPGGAGGDLLAGFTQSRIISREGFETFDPGNGVYDPRTTNLWLPFRAVDGTEIGVHTDPTFNPAGSGGGYWLNPYFNIVTTNEIPGAATGADGRGAELFEVHTGVESSGLGCGQLLVPPGGGTPRIPNCWLVVVPRGTPDEENAGTPFHQNQGEVFTSPVSPEAWQHRIAIPLEFNPVDTACSLADQDRRLVGTEVIIEAVASWQTELCTLPDLPPYSYASVSDDTARLQLANPSPGGPGMIVVARPLDPGLVAPDNPAVYAPLTLSGITIGFTIERVAKTDAPADEQALAGVRVADLDLTPRLVAKLLTQSYRQQVEINSIPDYGWLDGNPRNMGEDPDFLQFNEEFELLSPRSSRNLGGLALPAGNSDYARQVWEWVLADPEAAAWLAGEADPWGMVVNPVYATNAQVNPTGAPFGDPVPESFPKSDPYCLDIGLTGHLDPPPLCGTDWKPYTGGLREAARQTRAVYDGAKIGADVFAPSNDRYWVRVGLETLGTRGFLSLTDTASASRFGVQMARLSRAGDNGPDRQFVAPDDAGLIAGVSAMGPGAEPQVLEPDPRAGAPGAYPLTVLTYAAITPLALDQQSRAEYAAFVTYAAGPGQEPGLELGQLPAGYTPLPDPLRVRAQLSAQAIVDLQPPQPAPAEPTATAPPAAAPSGPSTVTPSRSSRSSGGASNNAPASAPAADGPPPTTPPETEELASGALTPASSTGSARFVPPVLAVLAVLSALGALEITKRPRRAGADGGTS